MAINPPPRRLPEKILSDPALLPYFRELQDHLSSLYEAIAGNVSVKAYLTGDRMFSGNPDLAIDTNFDVQTQNAIVVAIDGALYDVAAATCDTGTSATFLAATWGIFLVSSDSAGSLTATWATKGGSGYATEEEAIRALPDPPDDEAPVGYVTVKADGSNPFTAGTDALQGGTGGNPSPDTNYYNQADAGRTLARSIG